MASSRFRYLAFALSAVSLLNGLLVAVGHHHPCGDHAAGPAESSRHGGDCCASEDASLGIAGLPHQNRHAPADHSHPSEHCLICRYLAQPGAQPHWDGPAGPAAVLFWTEEPGETSIVAIRIAMFDVRGPPA